MPHERIRVIDHTTGEIFRSLSEAAPHLFVTCSGLASAYRKRGNRFIFAGHDLEFVPTGETTHRRIVRCIETGKTYPSVKEAAKAVGVHQAYMSAHLNGHVGAVKKLHFRKFPK